MNVERTYKKNPHHKTNTQGHRSVIKWRDFKVDVDVSPRIHFSARARTNFLLLTYGEFGKSEHDGKKENIHQSPYK